MVLCLKKYLVSGFALLALACLMGGCGESATPEETAPPYARTEDPEYREKLEGLRQLQNQLMSELEAARQEVRAAEAADPDGTSERVKQAQARRAAALQKIDEARQEAQALVREYIWKELNANEAQQKKGN